MPSRSQRSCAPAPTAAAPLTCQNTCDALAPLTRSTLAPAAILSAPPTWKTKTAFGSPPPSRVSVPVFATAPAAEYKPGVSVTPARSPAIAVPALRPETSLYAETRSLYPGPAVAPTRVAPVTTPGGKPVGCVAALTPRSPRKVVNGAPGALTVLPTEAPLSTAYVEAWPRFTVGVEAARADGTAIARLAVSRAPARTTKRSSLVPRVPPACDSEDPRLSARTKSRPRDTD